MAEMTTPIDFMHQLMYKLSHTYQDNPNKLNLALADLTDIEGLTQITDWTQLRDMIKADITTNLSGGGTAKDFLKNYCNIDLDNEDCGALIGYDCSGGEILTNDNIINEEGDLQTHPATADIRGCTVTFPTYSNSTYNYVMDGLYTWWIGLPFDLVNESYGLGFTEDSYVTSMPLNLFNEPISGGIILGAYVDTYYAGTIAVGLELCVNMNDMAFGTIIIGDKSGNTTSGVFAALDRILAHELTHAVMSANIQGSMQWLPEWFTEGGTAELVNGCDDSRTSDLLEAAVNTAIIDDGFSDNPTMTNEYSVGFIAMRYLLKKYTDRQVQPPHIYFPVKPKEPFEKVWEKMAHGIRSEHCISRDGDLNKIMDEFVDFCQRDDYNLVQSWTLCSNEGSKTLRIPLEGHEEKTEDAVITFFPAKFLDLNHVTVLNTNIITNTDYFDDEYYYHNTSIGVIERTIFCDTINNIESRCVWARDSFGVEVKPIICHNVQDSIDNVVDMYINHKTMYDTEESILNSYINASILVMLDNCDITFFTKEQYAQLFSAVNSVIDRKYDGTKYWINAVVVQQNSKLPSDYNIIRNMSDEEFLSYFNSVPSNEEQELIDFIEENGGYYIDNRDEILGAISYYQNLYNYTSHTLGESYGLLLDYSLPCTIAGGFCNIIFGANFVYGTFPRNYFIMTAIRANFNKWRITKKEILDFPCFYLSTGVFTPKDWSNQGLVYPSQVINNQDDEYIPFNIHVLNDINMRFDVQGIGTCKKVTGKQNDADILNGIRQTGQYSYVADVISDPIPGIGCPLIVRSVEDKSKYTDIMCYFTKSSYSGTFTLIFYNENDETINPVFQSVAFGLGISEEESYKYPLYTAGGTSGLLPAWYSFSYTIPGRPPTTVTLHVYGNKFNCDMAKGDTLDSLLYPLTTDRCGISNFRLLQSDGEWKSAINYKQYFYGEEKRTIGSYVYKNDSDDTEDYLVYPTISNTNLVDRFTLVQPITVIKKHLTGENESGFMLSINGVKCKPDRLRSMMTSIDGHEYLIVPNGWFDRTLGIPLRPLQQGEYLIDVITDLVDKMPKQTYVLCIDLG